MKNMHTSYPSLLLSISTIQASEQFKLMANLNGFVTLGDVVESDLDLLPNRQGSGIKILKEALDLLQAYGLGQLAED